MNHGVRIMNRRILIGTMLALGAGLASIGIAAAQDAYPSRPIRVIVPTPPGGPVDVVARLVAQYLSTAIGQSVVVDNRPGAGNTIGSREAARAEPDGYTLHYSSISGLVLAPMLHKDPGYDPIKSFTPIAAVATTSIILVVNPSFPAKSVTELVDYAKANPGKVNFSSGGIGVLPHLIGEMFKARAAVNIVHVPYKGGGPSIQDVVAGNIQMTFEGTGVLLPLIESGKLRALAVTSGRRNPAIPDVPTMV
jgi:tripartite-type tricarboxylate transporter receptor subunit TctC